MEASITSIELATIQEQRDTVTKERDNFKEAYNRLNFCNAQNCNCHNWYM